jgi:hypothetical protein
MIDKTTEGFTAEPDEVEAVLHNLCGYHLTEPDPAHRYEVLTREQVLYDALVNSIKRERGRALADMVAAGHSLTRIAEVTNLRTRQRVQRLIAVSKAAEEAAAAVQAASREFHEKLAAVEATLDEVVSGLSPEAAPLPELPIEAGLADGLNVAVESPKPAPLEDGLVDALSEPTQVVPALTTIIHPTRESNEEPTPWWRRSRDTGAA